MLNAPDVIYLYYSLHDFQGISSIDSKETFIKKLEQTYPQKTFKVISNEFDGYSAFEENGVIESAYKQN